MNLDPTTVIPDYPSAEAEKALDLEKYTGAPVKQGAAVPPAMPGIGISVPSVGGGGGGGLAIVAGIAGLAVIVGVAVVMSKSKKGKR